MTLRGIRCDSKREFPTPALGAWKPAHNAGSHISTATTAAGSFQNEDETPLKSRVSSDSCTEPKKICAKEPVRAVKVAERLRVLEELKSQKADGKLKVRRQSRSSNTTKYHSAECCPVDSRRKVRERPKNGGEHSGVSPGPGISASCSKRILFFICATHCLTTAVCGPSTPDRRRRPPLSYTSASRPVRRALLVCL